MRKVLYLSLLVAAIASGYAYAQVYTGQPNPVALVCAYNAIVPTPTAGQFFYVQCDSTGKLIIQ